MIVISSESSVAWYFAVRGYLRSSSAIFQSLERANLMVLAWFDFAVEEKFTENKVLDETNFTSIMPQDRQMR